MENRPLSAADRREAFAATRKLTLLDRHEALALRYEAQTVSSLRRQLAASYLQRAGVHPDQRREYRQALENIREGSGYPVEALIEEFRLDYVNRLAPD